MGGGHHGHEPEYTIPSPDIYKIDDRVPELQLLQSRLAEKGLKDPWIRNEVWRHHCHRGTPLTRALKVWSKGAIFGTTAFLITIAVEQHLGIGGHGHDDGHNDGHH